MILMKAQVRFSVFCGHTFVFSSTRFGLLKVEGNVLNFCRVHMRRVAISPRKCLMVRELVEGRYMSHNSCPETFV